MDSVYDILADEVTSSSCQRPAVIANNKLIKQAQTVLFFPVFAQTVLRVPSTELPDPTRESFLWLSASKLTLLTFALPTFWKYSIQIIARKFE